MPLTGTNNALCRVKISSDADASANALRPAANQRLR
jgi:hypothetical protein